MSLLATKVAALLQQALVVCHLPCPRFLILSPLVFLLCFPPLRCFVVCAGCATIGGSLLVGWGVGGAAVASVRRCRCWALASSLRVVAVQSGQSASNCVHVSQYECSCRAASNFRLRCLRPIFLRGGQVPRAAGSAAPHAFLHVEYDARALRLRRRPLSQSTEARDPANAQRVLRSTQSSWRRALLHYVTCPVPTRLERRWTRLPI